MLLAEKMNRITAVFLRQDMDRVAEEVAKAGVLHLTKIEETDAWAENLVTADVQRLTQECADRRTRLIGLIGGLPKHEAPGPSVAKDAATCDFREMDALIQRGESALSPLFATRAQLSARLSQVRGSLTQLGALLPSPLPLAGLLRASMVFTAVGVLHQTHIPRLQGLLKGIPSVVVPFRQEENDTHIVCLVLRRDKETLMRALREVPFVELPIPANASTISEDARGALAQEVQTVETQIAENEAAIRTAQNIALPEMIRALHRLDATMLMLRVEASCRLTEKTCSFAGWVPAQQTEPLVAAIREKTGGRAVVEVADAGTLDAVKEGKIEVPAFFHRPAALQPFALVTENYAVPSYRMIDPTLFVAITFLIMFGMMFGDVGHGFIVCVLGLFVLFRVPQFKDIGKLAIYCGTASIVFGILYGSVFGLEYPQIPLRPLWVKPMEGIDQLFRFAIIFGIVVINLGILLNTLNAIRTHNFWESLFDGAGLLTGIIYWSGIGLVVKSFFSSGESGPADVFAALIVVCLVLFVLKGPLLRLFGRTDRAFPEGVVSYGMEKAIEVMEIFMGYLANTVSFIRVAAFGLAHAGLFAAVFGLADMVENAPGGQVISWCVIVAGNILIISLEGLVVTIQALRLEYYEFFGKFFKQTGNKYAPVGPSSAPSDAAN